MKQRPITVRELADYMGALAEFESHRGSVGATVELARVFFSRWELVVIAFKILWLAIRKRET